MKTITVSITNTGPSAQVVPVVDGTVTVHSQKSLRDVAILPLTPERVRHYAERGVIFSGRGLPRSEDALAARKAADEDAARIAEEDAARRQALAEAQAEADRKAAEEEAERKVAKAEADRKAAEEEAGRKAAEAKAEADRKAAEKSAKKKGDQSDDLLGSGQ